MIYENIINKKCDMYMMNTDNKEPFGLARVIPWQANPHRNKPHALVDITPSLREYHVHCTLSDWSGT